MSDHKFHIIHTESSGGWGGQEIRILNEIKEFIRIGHKVTLICDTDSPIALRSKEYNITTVELPIGKKTLKGLFALRQWIANNNFDLINTHSSSDSWMVALAMRLVFKANKPIVRTRHVSAPVSNNRATQWLYKKAANHIVTTGEKLRETLIRDNGIDATKITSVPTGIDCQLFTPSKDKNLVRKNLKLPEDKIIIGIVATLRSWKGHAYLINAFASINRKDTHLLIVGNGPQWDNINQQIKQLDIEDNVTLCGEQKDVTPWLQAMDIFALPSYANEGVPQGIMQAMSCELPVISTTVGSITEILNRNTGLVIPPEDEQALKNSVLHLIDNQQERESLGKNARDFAIKQCGINKMSADMEHIFSKVIKEYHG